jgi:malate dehydrogenase (oxaloacetate-decarboxylating)
LGSAGTGRLAKEPCVVVAEYESRRAKCARAIRSVLLQGVEPAIMAKIQVQKKGFDVLRDPLLNKGLAFTRQERLDLGLEGILPPGIRTIEEQIKITYQEFKCLGDPDRQFDFLRGLQDRSETLFFALVLEHLDEIVPIIYTPTVGKACQEYSDRFQQARGVYISKHNIDRAREAFAPYHGIEMIVCTDNQGILGIGDQGAGGMGIPVGKLALYTAGAGIHPSACLPISLDVGTNNEQLLSHPHYLGIKERRLTGREYDECLEAFARAAKERFPHAVMQWEDFSRQNAFSVLDRYRDYLISFNDDIQGTGAVAMAGIYGACRITGKKPSESRYIIFGAGAGGIGIARQIQAAIREEGLSAKEAAERIFILDSRGLCYDGRPSGGVDPYKAEFARSKEWAEKNCPGKETIELLDAVKASLADVLIGTSGIPGLFTEEIVRAMAENAKRPVIFPLSNPTSNCECTPEQVYNWTEGRGITATGSPFPDVEYKGKRYRIGQCNNAFIFPGVGLGLIVCRARKVTDEMFTAASKALAGLLPADDLQAGCLYPRISKIREASGLVALAVAKQGAEQNVADPSFEPTAEKIQEKMWEPVYPEYEYTPPE